jgi:hypothetical protein
VSCTTGCGRKDGGSSRYFQIASKPRRAGTTITSCVVVERLAEGSAMENGVFGGELTVIELDAVRQAVTRIEYGSSELLGWPGIADLAVIWQAEVRPLVERPTPHAEAWLAADRLIRAYEELDSPFFALSLLVNEFAWDHDARQRFIQRALLVRAPDSP